MMLPGMGLDDSLKGILDFGRLMDGEDRKTRDPDDIEHWRAVYADLVGFKRKMLSDAQEHIEAVPATKKELAGNDLPFLEAEMGRLQRGLEFWEARRKELGR